MVVSQYNQSGLTFPLSGTGISRGTGYVQPVVDTTIPKALEPEFETLLIALLKILREEAHTSFPSRDRARPSKVVYVLSSKEFQALPLFRTPIKINFEVWALICAPILDTLAPLQPAPFWFSLEGIRNLEALLRKTLIDNSYVP